MKLHADPEAVPLACPQGRTRKSASYLCSTNGRPEGEGSVPHDTVSRKRQEDES